MTKFLIIRHGQSEANLLDVFAGNFDAPLTERGLCQAQRTAEYIKDNFKSIILMLIFIIVVNIELPYYIEAPGGTINLTKRNRLLTKNITKNKTEEQHD